MIDARMRCVQLARAELYGCRLDRADLSRADLRDLQSSSGILPQIVVKRRDATATILAADTVQQQVHDAEPRHAVHQIHAVQCACPKRLKLIAVRFGMRHRPERTDCVFE